MSHRDELRAIESRAAKVAYAKKNSLKVEAKPETSDRLRLRIIDKDGRVLDEFSCSVVNCPRILSGERSTTEPPRRWRFYETVSGAKPVQDYLNALPKREQEKVREEMADVKTRGLKAAKHLMRGIYQVYAETGSKSMRLLFSPEGKQGNILLALHIFDKNTDSTPREDIFLALSRLADWRRRGDEVAGRGRYSGRPSRP